MSKPLASTDNSPNRTGISPGCVNNSTDCTDTSPERTACSPGCANNSTDCTDTSPERTACSPGCVNNSTDCTDTSPERTACSPDCSDNSLEPFVSCRILELCRKNGKTRYWLAKNSGISDSNIKKYIVCKALPTLPLLKRICNAFAITLSQFFSQNDQNTDLSKQALDVAHLWSSLNLKDRENVIRHMQGLKELEDAEAAANNEKTSST